MHTRVMDFTCYYLCMHTLNSLNLSLTYGEIRWQERAITKKLSEFAKKLISKACSNIKCKVFLKH